MELEEGKEKFIESWGTLASEWGIKPTVAQIHALLLVAHEPMDSDTIMRELKFSRGGVNMGIHTLIDWGLVYKRRISGERKDFFEAEKDIWTVFKQILVNRKKKELDPMIKMLGEISQVQPVCPASESFHKTVSEIHKVSGKANRTLDYLIKSDATILGRLFGPFFR